MYGHTTYEEVCCCAKVVSLVWLAFLVLPVSVETDWLHGVATGVTTLTGCETSVKLHLTAPFLKSHQKFQVSVKDESVTEKGCGRTTYNILRRQKECGITSPLPLLPVYRSPGDSYVSHINTEISRKGGIDHVFTGDKAVRYPTKQLSANWSARFSLIGWFSMQTSKGRQYLVTWSDQQKHPEYMGLYLVRHERAKHTTFGFHHKTTGCSTNMKWKVKNTSSKWSHLVLNVEGCFVELWIDGTKIEGVTGHYHYHHPEVAHLHPKFVVGARWEGGVRKYADYFKGRISGLVLSNQISTQVQVACLLRCEQSLDLSRLPVNMLQNNADRSVTFSVSGHTLEHLLQNSMFYRVPLTSDKQLVRISMKVTDLERGVDISSHLQLRVLRNNTKLEVRCPHSNHVYNKQTICSQLKILSSACQQTVDMAIVTYTLDKHESIVLTSDSIREGVRVITSENKLTIQGVAHVSDYTEMLSSLQFLSNSSDVDSKLTREVHVVVSSLNGLYHSNELTIPLNILSPPPSHTTYPATYRRPPHTAVVDDEDRQKMIWIACGSILFLVFVLFALSYVSHKRRLALKGGWYDPSPEQGQPDVQYIVEERPLTPSLLIDPEERVGVCNDPYKDIIMARRDGARHQTDGETSTDESEDDDTDSIRQLEWDCLENSLDTILRDEMVMESRIPNIDLEKQTYL